MKKSSSIASVEKEAAKVVYAVATSKDLNVYCSLVCLLKDRAQCTRFGIEL